MKRRPIDSEGTEATLKAIYKDRLEDDALLRLACVRLRVLSSDGQFSSEQALEDLIRAIVHKRLLDLRQAANPDASVNPKAPLNSALRDDFAARHREREAWSALFHYDLSPARYGIEDITTAADISISTLKRRRKLGFELLAAALNKAEMEAVPKLAALEPDRAAVEDYRRACRDRWRHEDFMLDQRFVRLGLLVDRGEKIGWQEDDRHFDSLSEILEAIDDTALVILGAPGAGKSTLMRRLEYDLSELALAGEDVPITFFVQLNGYRSDRPGTPPPPPMDWLSTFWAKHHPEMPALARLLENRGMLLLLDALNEMPHDSPRAYRERVDAWKVFIQQLHFHYPGNRVIFTCRSLDYSAPLSTAAQRVPQVRVESMGEAEVRAFLAAYLQPDQAKSIWSELTSDRTRLAALKTPYLLKLLVDQVHENGTLPLGSVGLFAGFVRGALRREIQCDNPLMDAEGLITDHDRRRIIQTEPWNWQTPWDIPSDGQLIPSLAKLAFNMQRAHGSGSGSQVRIDFAEAIAILGQRDAPDILEAGTSMGLLDIDLRSDEVLFFHQLLQEFFAARQLAAHPDPDLVRAVWRADAIKPSLEETIAALAPAEPLPPLPSTGWEETTVMASVMAEDADAVVRGLMETNLPLAGRCAAQAESHVSEALAEELRWLLVDRSRDPDTDLRARIEAGDSLGYLGDPRLKRSEGPHGCYLVPPLITIEAGDFTLGSNDSVVTFSGPEATAHVARFALGQYPVTNAEWSYFRRCGGYDNPRWWDTDAAESWRSGRATAFGMRAQARYWTLRFREDADYFDRACSAGHLGRHEIELWRSRIEMSDRELEEHLSKQFPNIRFTTPSTWGDVKMANPSRPVAGISWFEARAYCNWLAAQTGMNFMLPSSAQLEAATRGRGALRYAFGNEHIPSACNTSELHLRTTNPIGIFSEGESLQGITDLTGNVCEWTSTNAGHRIDQPEFRRPYRSDDGREEHTADATMARIAQGGSWTQSAKDSLAFSQYGAYPDSREPHLGMRVARALE